MNAHQCCDMGSSTSHREVLEPRIEQPTIARRGLGIARWMVPGAILAVLPKCPMCLAAYVAIGIGVGLSRTAATYLWTLLIILCVASLFFLGARQVRRLIGWRFLGNIAAQEPYSLK